ncbi:UNVERIFIED_CONTAM: phage Gp37/Gp68 family protein [Methylobacteriaceae bacterium AG10]|nr:phage Gp37/Gp68 family protein [Methylobacteriaceae bacterium AG10]
MAQSTSIEWTEATWNPVRGCTRVSPGCGGPGPHGGCYAEGIAARFSGPGMAYEGLAEMRAGKPRWTGKLSFGHDLDAPLRWRRPQRIFVNSMSDLFHEGLAVHEIATVYAVCVAAHHLRGHTFQILTKRSDRMREVLASEEFWDQVNAEAGMHVMERTDALDRRSDDARATLEDYGPDAPPPGIWLGVSAEDQRRADERVPDLLATPAAVRFVSAEPLLGPIDFFTIADRLGSQIDALRPGVAWLHGHEDGNWHGVAGSHPALDWIIVGGDSGPNARPMHPAWARSIRDQCAAAGVAYHFKQHGAWAAIDQSAGADEAGWQGRGDWMILSADGDLDIPDDRWPDEAAGEVAVVRVGKKAAGRLLDGVTHDGFPTPTAPDRKDLSGQNVSLSTSNRRSGNATATKGELLSSEGDSIPSLSEPVERSQLRIEPKPEDDQ